MRYISAELTKFLYLIICRHLPLYLVAAFVKRIARLALTAPPNGMATLTLYPSLVLRFSEGLVDLVM